MAGLVPAIHAAPVQRRVRHLSTGRKALQGRGFSSRGFLFNSTNTWIAGTSPAMTLSDAAALLHPQTHRTTANAIRANRFTEILEGIGLILLKPEKPTMIIGDGQLDFPKLRDRAVLQIYNQGVLPGEAEFFLLFSAITL
jgi:hypothetical protein